MLKILARFCCIFVKKRFKNMSISYPHWVVLFSRIPFVWIITIEDNFEYGILTAFATGHFSRVGQWAGRFDPASLKTPHRLSPLSALSGRARRRIYAGGGVY